MKKTRIPFKDFPSARHSIVVGPTLLISPFPANGGIRPGACTLRERPDALGSPPEDHAIPTSTLPNGWPGRGGWVIMGI
ncbi:hypothetical protein ATKI12_0143 [Kitasatospora sp. Ki12]